MVHKTTKTTHGIENKNTPKEMLHEEEMNIHFRGRKKIIT